jgi:hypothetical protein
MSTCFFVAGISNCAEVETGIQHIIADVIAKDKEVMEEIRKMYVLTFLTHRHRALYIFNVKIVSCTVESRFVKINLL